VFARADRRLLVGVVHLLPLPGAPRGSPGLNAVIERALADARAISDGGADALIVENYGDAPFGSGPVEPATVAAMTRVVAAVRQAVPIPIGVNVLRNDALAALGIAAACDARFVRVNVLSGAMVTDQGILQGEARALWLERNRLGAEIRIVADVLVKHAVPLGDVAIEDAARDLAERAGADVVVVSGRGTGLATDPARVRAVREVVRCPVWVGSGWRPDDPESGRHADGVIVGTWLHAGGDTRAPVEPARVAAARAALSSLG
jgi:uncharacterized protein